MHRQGLTQADAVPPEDVRTQLAQLLSARQLQASERRRAFLRFIVEETLAGRAGELKGYTIAVSVFGRDEGFDAHADPVVRLEARRLRQDLDSYYVDAGALDPVRISIPKGSYVPLFEWQAGGREAAEPADHHPTATPAASAPGAWRTGTAWLAAGLLTIAVVAGGWALTSRPMASPEPGPTVAVLPFQPLGSSEITGYLATGISEELIGDLMLFPGFRLYTLSAGAQSQTGGDVTSSYVVSGSVRAEADGIRVTSQLVDNQSGEVLWSRTFERPPTADALIGVQSDLAGEIASALGQPYGVVNNDLRQRAATPATSDIDSYVCVLRADAYRRSFSRAAFDPVLACLEQAVRREPGYSDAWAMLGYLHLDAGRYEFAGPGSVQAEYAKALEAASRAVGLDPGNALALKALSSINHYGGNYDEAEGLARRAVELNPHDPDALAQLGWRMAARGKFDEGIPLLRRAIDRTANPPGWYFHLVAIDEFLRGDYAAMLATARRSAVDGSGFSQGLIAIAAGAIGDRPATAAALQKMGANSLFAADPAAFFRRHGVTEETAAALLAGLAHARKLESGS